MQHLVNGRTLAWVLAVALVACSLVSDGLTQPALEQQSPGYGVLFGRVIVGPLPPPPQNGYGLPGPVPGGGPPAPVVGATIIVSRAGGSDVQSAITDTQGEYSVSLPEGSYRVTMHIPPNLGFTKDLPATVSISAGKETRLDIHVDTGIR